MSFFVLHMDKFKKEAVRGIQSHNLRERKSHSNPDIDYERSEGNYELHEGASGDYAKAVQNRIDDLLLTKAVRKDAVHMCGLIVSSDAEFFKDLSPKETKRFFNVCKEYLSMFVGSKNVISAMVHMDEKTPHMHFLHVPVTQDGRLNANDIYTREVLKNLQEYLPKYLQVHRFDIQRGVEQKPGSKKKHLDTREFKQQQKALDSLRQDVEAVGAFLKEGKQQEAALQERVQSYEQQVQEAEKELAAQSDIPKASMLNFKSALEQAQRIINLQKLSLAGKRILEKQNERLQEDVRELTKKNERLDAAYTAEKKKGIEAISAIHDQHTKVRAQFENIEKFFRWNQEANKMYLDYLQQERERAAREAAEVKRQTQAKEQREREDRDRREAALAREEKERDEKRERDKQDYLERRARGMGMGR